jgi:hypothetical protein
MNKLVTELLKNKQFDIKNKFDYLIIFIHAYIEYHFPQETVIRKISKSFRLLEITTIIIQRVTK